MRTKYEVNKEKRTVVCIITYAVDYDTSMPAVGVAHCNEADEWNEDLGKRLAGARAQVEMHKMLLKGERASQKRHVAYAKHYEERAAKHAKIVSNYKERIAKLRHGELD
jgi:hypothetical protein